MENLSNELNKPTIQKFERQKVIVNHINEIRSTDLVDMTQYSKFNKGYKYIFTNFDVFSKIAYSYPIKSKKIQDIKPCFEKIFKKTNPNIFGQIKNQLFSVKKCTNQPGSHWISLSRKNNSIFIFDSFGIGHIPENIYEIYKNFNIITNIYRIQHINSNLCGLFCVLFCLYEVNSKNKFIEFLNLFNVNDFIKNELV